MEECEKSLKWRKNENKNGSMRIISSGKMEGYLDSILGAPDYNSPGEYSTPQPGDIVIFAGSGHAGMCPGTEPRVGYFISGKIWLLNRATLLD